MAENQVDYRNNYSISSEDEKLLNDINKLYNICFADLLPGTTFRGDPTKLLHILSNILNKYSDNHLQDIGPHRILACSVKIIFLCDEDFYKSDKFLELKRNKNYKLGKQCYDNLLTIYRSKKMLDVINIVIEVMHEERFWQWEDLCYILISGLIDNGINGRDVMLHLLYKIEDEKTTSHDAILIIRVLNNNILENYSWSNDNETTIVIERFLKLFRNSISISEDSNTKNKRLKRSLQLSINKIVLNLSYNHRHFIIYRLCSWTVEESMDENEILELSSILKYAANVQKTNLLDNTLSNELFILIMQMIVSSSALVSVLGNRVLQYLIDRGKNRSQFELPQIFFENEKYEIQLAQYDNSDKEFLKRHREILHDTFVESWMKHSSIRLNLECMYCTICLIAVEIPCGFTAATLVCLIMNIQELTLDHVDMNREQSNEIHVTIMSIMTLICWIHNAKILYSHVNEVMMQRAQWAPHLNPPLQAHYSFATHHILWNKPEHFFIDWEVRFGLWKCFRLHIGKDEDKLIENNLE